ncbi:MAG: DUF99 family protein [Candidatus Heimdallarchaeota archaeon]|nr:DUF99 family protein [Candidatus Heimdallarchaeota archaeon]MCK4953901.1 DUF99 family protein [Candidatus Heimdallarchaeota archaeon]
MKSNVRTIGIDDAAFQREKSSKAFVFGVIIRGYSLVEGVLRTEVEVDGKDATERICQMLIQSKFHNQVKSIFLGSATIAAFNIIDLNFLYEHTSIPVVTILSQIPNEDEVKNAISHLVDWKKRYEILSSNPPIQQINFVNQLGRKCSMYIQYAGFERITEVQKLLEIASYSSCIPECLRLADLIGQSFKSFII